MQTAIFFARTVYCKRVGIEALEFVEHGDCRLNRSKIAALGNGNLHSPAELPRIKRKRWGKKCGQKAHAVQA